MGLFGPSASAPEPALPIPRATRAWPKAVPAVKAPPPAPAPAPEPPKALASAGTASKSPVQALPPAVRTPVATTAPAPTAVKPASAPSAASAGREPSHKEASSVVAAFANWKQATAAKTAVASRTETAPADVPPPKREDPVMYVYRAAVKQARGEHDAAIEDLSKAIEIDPTCTTAWAGRALSLEAKGDLAGARRDYAKSIEIELKQEIARLARPL